MLAETAKLSCEIPIFVVAAPHTHTHTKTHTLRRNTPEYRHSIQIYRRQRMRIHTAAAEHVCVRVIRSLEYTIISIYYQHDFFVFCCPLRGSEMMCTFAIIYKYKLYTAT